MDFSKELDAKIPDLNPCYGTFIGEREENLSVATSKLVSMMAAHKSLEKSSNKAGAAALYCEIAETRCLMARLQVEILLLRMLRAGDPKGRFFLGRYWLFTDYEKSVACTGVVGADYMATRQFVTELIDMAKHMTLAKVRQCVRGVEREAVDCGLADHNVEPCVVVEDYASVKVFRPYFYICKAAVDAIVTSERLKIGALSQLDHLLASKIVAQRSDDPNDGEIVCEPAEKNDQRGRYWKLFDENRQNDLMDEMQLALKEINAEEKEETV